MAHRRGPANSPTSTLPRPRAPPSRPPRHDDSAPYLPDHTTPVNLAIPSSGQLDLNPSRSQSTPVPSSRARKQPLPPHPTVRTTEPPPPLPSLATVLSPTSTPTHIPSPSATSTSLASPISPQTNTPARPRRLSTSYSSPTSPRAPARPFTKQLSSSSSSNSSSSSSITFPQKPRKHPDNVLANARVNQRFKYFPKVAVPGVLTQPPSRWVGFAENGDIKGVPVIIIGGHGCSRLVSVMFDDLGKRYGVRMIWPERPGYGLSEDSRCEEMKVLEWAGCMRVVFGARELRSRIQAPVWVGNGVVKDAIAQLADHLHIRRFSLIGQSVGAVFAMAVAHKYPMRILGPVYLISPWVSTYVANTFRWTRRLPASLFVGALNLAMDVMWSIDKLSSFSMDGWWGGNNAIPKETSSARSSLDHDRGSGDRMRRGRKGSSGTVSSASSSAGKGSAQGRSPLSADTGYGTNEEDDEEDLLAPPFVDIPTDFPEDRPLKHVVRARTVPLYFAMNAKRAAEPSTSGQLCDVVVALEKYQRFGFSYADVRCPVTVLWGDKDTLIPQNAIEWMVNNMRDVRIKVLEGEDHTLIWKEGVVEFTVRGIGDRWARGRGKQMGVPRVEVQEEEEVVEFGMAL
ncbi:Alpha/Beta hydrolase protein [Jimgerdemannia flammicorona]|uniref:Alpha/Beta hydrolase protein n=1 Tax=Jimgerdemannia flammicorona TaxID=994334 RepID=A0A433BAG6_9FUNG|nr:Alpha/Beta hydrolase protein [Jimgerdemannia flammicorona]